MFDQLSAEIRASLIKGFPTTTTRTTTKQNVDPVVYYVYSRVKTWLAEICKADPRVQPILNRFSYDLQQQKVLPIFKKSVFPNCPKKAHKSTSFAKIYR
jgi:hypothetical protein